MEAAGGASMGMLHLQCVFDGSISGHSDVNRRPYHRNCGCALHDKSSSSISGVGKSHRRNPSATTLCSASAISFPVRRSKSHGCLSLASSSVSAAAGAAISPSDQRSSRSSSSTCLWEMEMEMDREED